MTNQLGETTTIPRPPSAGDCDAHRTPVAGCCHSDQGLVLSRVLGGNGRNPKITGQAKTSEAHLMDLSDAILVTLGATEVWNVINRSDDLHAFQVHDIQFQILQRNGEPPAAGEAGLKDTVVVNPFETVRLIMRFDDFADPSMAYMYHCHLLNHEDNGMMGQFLVV